MPVSKRRKNKKTGKPVGRGYDRPSHLTLQDLINVVAYQEAHKDDAVEGVELPDFPTVIDMEDPTAESIIRAVSDASKLKEDQDGR